MNLFDIIPENEKYLIDSYINEYAEVNSKRKASLDHILRIWAENKEMLYKYLGSQLQIRKEIEYEMSQAAINNKMLELFRDDEKFAKICIKYREWLLSEDLPEDVKENAQILREVFSFGIFALNRVEMYFNESKFKISTPSGNTITVQNGAKPIRIISKLAKEFGVLTEQEVEYIRIKQSQVLNQKRIKGTLVLSIHPLDYMTMSDNASGWSSCMSWQDCGCYRRGTVEMMNSDQVVVAYIESEQPMTIWTPDGRKEWNNKKWRQLFVVNEDIISSVKSYPYFNEEITLTALNWLQELLEKNGGINFNNHNFIFESSNVYDSLFSDTYYFDFETNDMYNDFYTTTHYARLSDPEVTSYEICYSGPRECMCCGSTNGYFDDDEAPTLCCDDCYDVERCDGCGCACESTMELDGNYYCYDCYNDQAKNEFLTNEVHDEELMTNFVILPKSLRGSSEREIVEWIENNVIPDVYLRNEIALTDKYFISSNETFRVTDKRDDRKWYFYRAWMCFFEDSLREEYRDRIESYDPYDI